MIKEEKDFFQTCFNTVAGLEVTNESQAIAKKVVLSEIENLQQENKALLTLINWAEECGFGFDNFADDEYVNWEEFEKESNAMGYIESMIYYAKKYNEMQEPEGSDSNVKD